MTQVTSTHAVEVDASLYEPLVVKNLSATTVYYRNKLAVSSAVKDGELAETEEVTIRTPTFFVTKEGSADLRISASEAESGQIGSGQIKAEAVTEAKLASAVKRVVLGTAASEALKTLTAVESETGIEPSATKAALVTVGIVAKAEATAFKVESNAIVTAEVKATPAAGDVVNFGTFLVQPAKKIKLTKTTGAITSGLFSVQLMN